MLNLSTMVWTQPAIEGRPYCRVLARCHSATAIRDSILFFGGGPPGQTTASFTKFELHFNCATGEYDRAIWSSSLVPKAPPNTSSEDDGVGGNGAGSDHDGDRPLRPRERLRERRLAPRQNHSTFFTQGCLYIFGGCLARSFGSEELGDFFKVCLEENPNSEDNNMEIVASDKQEQSEDHRRGRPASQEYMLQRLLLLMQMQREMSDSDSR